MMVDYKIILILILSIVVLIIYNKIEYLKSLVSDLENKSKSFEDQIYLLEKKTNKLEEEIRESKKSDNCDIKKETKPVIEKKEEKQANPLLEKINLLHKEKFNTDKKMNDSVEKDTIEFKATEEPDSDSIFDPQQIEHSDNIVTYSNDKNENKEVEVEDLIDQLADKEIIKTNDNHQYLLEVDSSNSNESDKKNKEIVEESNTFVKDVKLDLDYENSIETSEKKNTSEKKSSIKDLMAFKLNELQNYAKENDIDITKIVDGKIKNKTKKELCSELEKKSCVSN